ncbi:PQQ-like beta-propeller repeat protein [Streptomyces sp. Isolate_219]|uniref:PQQ-like beta-propeller repeat protein n=1 Tax=Streptomyces sp. Isolate_219 TaxID=2950110 RepID=UPI0021C86C43|nr:PQQ-like beta-propeller repeat protein [Streptomyces sp. Isolate_219]MCR8577512.1 PQQ-like beta-propeller repeat protein [Streptomyces sp. Isolate_219]
MRSILKVSAALSATATLVLVAGCGGAAEPGADHKPKASKSKKPAASAPPRKSYDPPQKFDAKGAPLPQAAAGDSISMGGAIRKPLPLALHGTGAYAAAADSLQVIDTGTGTATSTVRPRHKSIAEKDAETNAPVLTQDGRQALVPFLVEFPGKGTTPSRAGIELDAVDTTTGKAAWTLDLDDLPSWAAQPATRARVVATTKSTAVISVGNGEMGATYAVDLDSRKTTWHDDKVAAAAVIGDTAVATTSKDSVRQQVIGLDINHDGKRSWSKLDGYELTVRPAGPHLVAITGTDYNSGDSVGVLLKPDGSKAADLTGDSSGLTCHYDDASVTVCQTEEPRTLALDATTGKQLWSLPEKGGNRVAPTVTAAWHGVVYGTTGNGPVALDAKTGADRSTSPGAAPVAVNEYTGVALDQADHRTLIAHPATG